MAASNLMRFALKYGVKSGPHVLVAAKALKEPATAYAQKLITAQQSLKAARAQAATLQAGTVLQVYHQGQPVWVVYSGDTPVSAHPGALAPLDLLVERADLTRRQRPEDLPTARDRLATAGERTTGRARAVLRRGRPES